jgi:hypothetical protein
MALLKEDDVFTHVVAIDFGTGASGYLSTQYLVMRLLPSIWIKMEKLELKSSTHAMAATIKKHLLPYSSMTMEISCSSVSMPSRNMLKSSRMATLPYSFKV